MSRAATMGARACLEAVAKLLQEAGPKMDKAYDEDNDVFIETAPIVVEGQMIARVFGPHRDREAAIAWLKAKRERNRIRAAAYWAGKDPDDKFHDGLLICHEEFKYRIIGYTEYAARYLAQIVMTALGGMVHMTQSPLTDKDFTTFNDGEEESDEA